MRRMTLSGFLAVLALGIGIPGPALAVKFRFPILDASKIQFDYVVYSDHDPETAFNQWECLPWCAGMQDGDWKCEENYPYCYDGHDGSDFMLVDGFLLMDEGSAEIVAAADGVVIATEDGNYDRCYANIITGDIDCNGNPMRGNYVKLRHPDGMETWYWHMMKDSVTVEVDQEVSCGDVLGKVGSSGYSSAPHPCLPI